MPNLFAEDVRIEARYLNAVNDAAVGGAANAGTGLGPVPGQLGKIIFLTDAQASVLSYTTTGTLRGGFYQYVQFLSTATASNVKGQLVFWSNTANFVVTPDSSAGTLGLVAGVTLNAVTKGNYGWIQIGGLASVLYQATVSDASTGNIVIVGQTTGFTADALADATTTFTNKLSKSILGIAVDQPVNATAKLVMIDPALFKAL